MKRIFGYEAIKLAAVLVLTALLSGGVAHSSRRRGE